MYWGLRPSPPVRQKRWTTLVYYDSLWITRTWWLGIVKPGVHTNDFAPIHRLRALKLGHASLATVFRPGRLTLQPILRENLESPVLRYQPITTAVVTDACLNTRWHHGAYTSAVLRESLGLDRVVTVVGAMDAELSRPDWLATVQSGRKQVQSRVCTPSLTHIKRPLIKITRWDARDMKKSYHGWRQGSDTTRRHNMASCLSCSPDGARENSRNAYEVIATDLS